MAFVTVSFYALAGLLLFSQGCVCFSFSSNGSSFSSSNVLVFFPLVSPRLRVFSSSSLLFHPSSSPTGLHVPHVLSRQRYIVGVLPLRIIIIPQLQVGVLVINLQPHILPQSSFPPTPSFYHDLFATCLYLLVHGIRGSLHERCRKRDDIQFQFQVSYSSERET